MWGLTSLQFGPLFLEVLSTDLGNFDPVESTCHLLVILKV